MHLSRDVIHTGYGTIIRITLVCYCKCCNLIGNSIHHLSIPQVAFLKYFMEYFSLTSSSTKTTGLINFCFHKVIVYASMLSYTCLVEITLYLKSRAQYN